MISYKWVKTPCSCSVTLLVLFHELLWIKLPKVLFYFVVVIFFFCRSKWIKEKESILWSWKVDALTKVDGGGGGGGGDDNETCCIVCQIGYCTLAPTKIHRSEIF